MKVICEHDIPASRIADLFITAFEGGSGYWAASAALTTPNPDTLSARPWYSDASLYDRPDFKIIITNEEEKEAYAIDRAALEKGLQIMATKYASHFGDFLNDNEDAITADVFLQCVALGKIVYG